LSHSTSTGIFQKQDLWTCHQITQKRNNQIFDKKNYSILGMPPRVIAVTAIVSFW
jgi:hypothetical protein